MNVVRQVLLFGILVCHSQEQLEDKKMFNNAVEISVHSCQEKCEIKSKIDHDFKKRCQDIFSSDLEKERPILKFSSQSESNFDVCPSKIRAKLVGNKVLLSVNGHCNCSKGYCKDANNRIILWSTPNLCNLTSICANYRIEANNKESVPEEVNSTQFGQELCTILNSRPEKNQQQIVDETGKTLENEIAEIHTLQLFNYFLVIAVGVFLLYYVFNLLVNFCTLWTAGKKKISKSKAHLLNCVFQSMTDRYLFLNTTNDATYAVQTMSKLEKSVNNLYESIEER